jgi:hypothetical protein
VFSRDAQPFLQDLTHDGDQETEAADTFVPVSGLLSGRHRGRANDSFQPRGWGNFFGLRRFAFGYGRKFPRLVPNQQIGNDIVSNAHYFVTIHLKKLDPMVEALDPPFKTDPWQEVAPDDSPLLRRMDPNDVKTLFASQSLAWAHLPILTGSGRWMDLTGITTGTTTSTGRSEQDQTEVGRVQ